MRNPIGWLYQKSDDAIMHCANKGVKAWNWTTGQTKADLANQLLTVAPISESVGAFLINPSLAGVATSIFLLNSHREQKRNISHEIREREAAKNGLKYHNPQFEFHNRECGFVYGIVGIYNDSIGFVIDSPGSIFFGGGTMIRSASHYVQLNREPKLKCKS